MEKTKSANRVLILLCGVVSSLIPGFCYTYSIIQPYIMDYFSIESSTASLPYTIFLAVFLLGSYVGGVMQKKVNVKTILLIGCLLMAVGIFSTSLQPLPSECGLLTADYLASATERCIM